MAEPHQKWSGKSRGGYWGNLCFFWLIKYIGLWSAYLLLWPVALYFIPAAPAATVALWDYYRRSLHCGKLASMLNIYLHYYRFGQILIDKIALNEGMTPQYRFNTDEVDEFLKKFIPISSKGAIFIGAHIGNWESGSHLFGDFANKMHFVMFRNQANQKHTDYSPNTLSRIIPLSENPLDYLLQIKSTLDQGEFICIQGDRYIQGQRTLSANFMGREALFPQGPFHLSARFRVPVIFYFATRHPHKTYRFNFRIAEPVQTNSHVSPALQLLHQYITALEEILSQTPQQWFNFYCFWDSAAISQIK